MLNAYAMSLEPCGMRSPLQPRGAVGATAASTNTHAVGRKSGASRASFIQHADGILHQVPGRNPQLQCRICQDIDGLSLDCPPRASFVRRDTWRPNIKDFITTTTPILPHASPMSDFPSCARSACLEQSGKKARFADIKEELKMRFAVLN